MVRKGRAGMSGQRVNNEWRKKRTTRRVKEIRTCTGDELSK